MCVLYLRLLDQTFSLHTKKVGLVINYLNNYLQIKKLLILPSLPSPPSSSLLVRPFGTWQGSIEEEGELLKRNHGEISGWKSSSALKSTTSISRNYLIRLSSLVPFLPLSPPPFPPDAALVQWVEHSVYSADHSDIRGALVAGTPISPLVAGASRQTRHKPFPLPTPPRPPPPAPALLGPPPRRTCPRRVLPQKRGGDSRH